MVLTAADDDQRSEPAVSFFLRDEWDWEGFGEPGDKADEFSLGVQHISVTGPLCASMTMLKGRLDRKV
jgi:hypothetical protein